MLVPALGAADLVLSADKTTAAVGEPITITCSVTGAPAFAVWGAVIRLPPSGLGITGQGAGTALVHVRDSRTPATGEVRFGGHAASPSFTALGAGTHALGRITVVATAPGTYTVRAPSFGPSEPFGGILLPKTLGVPVVPTAAPDLVLTIGGAAVNQPPAISKPAVADPTALVLP
jgi:hypothetical protein